MNIGGCFNDSLAALTAEADATVRITPYRGLHVNLRDDSGNPLGTEANPLYVSGGGGGGGNVNIFDSAGNDLDSTSGALDVQIQNSSIAVTGTFWQTTQPVSGTVTAKIQDSAGNSLDSTSNALNVYLTNGGSGGTSAEDESAFTAGTTTGTPMMGAYVSSLAAVSSGEVAIPYITAYRGQHVNLRNSSGTEIGTSGNPVYVNVTNAGSGGTASTDETAFTAGTTQGTPSMGVYNSSLATVSTGELGVYQMTEYRAQHVNIRDASGNAVNVTSNALNVQVENSSIAVTGTFWQATQPISGTVTADQGGSWTVGVSGSVAVTGTFWQTTQPVSGTFWQSTQPVSIAASVTVAQSTAADLNVTAVQSGDWEIQGDVASGSSDSGNPVKIGGIYNSQPGTAASSGDRVQALIDEQGELVVHHAPVAWVNRQYTAITTTTTTTIATAGGSGVYQDLAQLIITNSASSAVSVTIADDTTTVMVIDIAANGGAVIPFPVPIPQATANEAWTATLSAATSTIHITAITLDRK